MPISAKKTYNITSWGLTTIMTILASHTLEIQNYLFFRFIIILLITKNITKIITKIAEVSQRFHFGASGSPKVSLAEVLVGKGSPKRGGHQNGSFLKNPKHVKNFEFFLFFRFFSRFFHLVVMFFFVFFPIVFPFWWFPALLPQRSAEATKMADF